VLAPTIGVLIAARAFQGAAGGVWWCRARSRHVGVFALNELDTREAAILARVSE
jgi:hypothetical protein